MSFPPKDEKTIANREVVKNTFKFFKQHIELKSLTLEIDQYGRETMISFYREINHEGLKMEEGNYEILYHSGKDSKHSNTIIEWFVKKNITVVLKNYHGEYVD